MVQTLSLFLPIDRQLSGIAGIAIAQVEKWIRVVHGQEGA